MSGKIIKYLNFEPVIGNNVLLSNTSWIIGNTVLYDFVNVSDNVVIRGDAKKIVIGESTIIKERSTIHVASDFFGTSIGKKCIIGKFSVIHACTLGNEVLVGDNSVIMDGSEIGDNCVILRDSLIPPRKSFGSYSLIGGAPAKILKKLTAKEYKSYFNPKKKEYLFSNNNFYKKVLNLEINQKPINKNFNDKSIFVASDLKASSLIKMKNNSSIWFSVTVMERFKKIGFLKLGQGSNIQDNSIIINNGKNILIGNRVTIGHNVIILGHVKIEDDAVIGIGSVLNDGVIVKKNAIVAAKSIVKENTIVKKKTVYAGDPSVFMRPVKDTEIKYFSLGQKVYEKLANSYNLVR